MPIYDLGLEHVSLSFATKDIFDDVTQGICEGDRIGIVGRNGDGKSTLLRLLSKQIEPDSGRVTRRGGLTLGVLDQRDPLNDDDSLRKAALGNREDYEWASDAQSREIVETLLAGMDLDSPVGSLSGGQRRRADLARLLLKDWDILALDEPTNHLDIVTIHWLAEHLRNRWPKGSGALLLVTHDRWFLDEVCSSMWEVHDGTIDPFEGGYSAYMLQRVERDRQAEVAENKRQNLARKELAWLTRGARARSTKQKFHVKAATELIADVPPMRNTLELKRMATSRLGKQVVDLKDVTKSYPIANKPNQTRTVIDDVTWLIGPGDRFGVVGANGAGKSTLLGLIDGSVQPTAGRVNIGKTVKFAVLTQRLDELETLGAYKIQEILSRYKSNYELEGKEVTPTQLMERLGFSSAQLMTRIQDLSGGQKRRMQLLLILLDEPNVLIMDEPGNDLDTDMLAVMEDLLDSWPGTLIVVSHDRYLLERVTDQQFALIGGKVTHLPGGVDDYLAMVEQHLSLNTLSSSGSDTPGQDSALSITSQEAGKSASGKSARQNQHELNKKSRAIERKLTKLNQEIHDLQTNMAEHDPSDYAGLSALNEQVKTIRAQIDSLEEEWLSIGEQLED
ncbi:ABC-F family ATP-binding cassette domain-containing protein [Bombiscardovia coagulans]|uniref:ABC transporter ATP-binding protein n=1 Tax=Bombiscardovia coagulans TaxID=686666 RepID=A0A261EUX3_9BIFI|nr:ABC-F family ATP-binding cassette domain-containing protein [Bombiscardovia coagulans]OZG50668.1 ABC transporter ATP-binding protein [Bombiscardovia coagulans]